MGGCGPHNPCGSTAPQQSMGQQMSATGGGGGGCCGSGSSIRNNNASVQELISQPPPLINIQQNTAQSGAAGGGCCSGKTQPIVDRSPEMTLMEMMMDKLTNNSDFEKQTMGEDLDSSGGGGGCSCKDPNEGVQKGCCIVICLKTLETLKFLIMQKDSLAAAAACRPKVASSQRSNLLGRCNKNNLACCGSPALCN